MAKKKSTRKRSSKGGKTPTELSKAGYPKGGRPPDYKPEFVATVKKLSKLGHTEFEIANFLEVDETTLWRWKLVHPLFCKALTLGKGAFDKRIEKSLAHRAIGYSHPDTHVSVIEGVVVLTPIVRHYPPSEGAIKLWLTNRQPRKWRDIKSSVITTPPGQPLEHRHTYGSGETLDEYYRRSAALAADQESISDDSAAGGDTDLGEGDTPGT